MGYRVMIWYMYKTVMIKSESLMFLSSYTFATSLHGELWKFSLLALYKIYNKVL